jgi:hypothetical protein
VYIKFFMHIVQNRNALIHNVRNLCPQWHLTLVYTW